MMDYKKIVLLAMSTLIIMTAIALLVWIGFGPVN